MASNVLFYSATSVSCCAITNLKAGHDYFPQNSFELNRPSPSYVRGCHEGEHIVGSVTRDTVCFVGG
jgi:hypothetical protein